MGSVVNLSFTSPVNTGHQPVLSTDDVWKGLEYITRRPQDVVNYLSGCEILDDTGVNLKRRLVFKEGPNMPDKPMEQDVVFCPKMKVGCLSNSQSMPSQYQILIIHQVEYIGSTGNSTLMITAGEGANEVYLSQAMQDPYRPGVLPGSPEAAEFKEHLSRMAKSNIKNSIEFLRQLKANGQL